jgi:hypothetical protein
MLGPCLPFPIDDRAANGQVELGGSQEGLLEAFVVALVRQRIQDRVFQFVNIIGNVVFGVTPH